MQINPKAIVEEAGKAAKTAERFPWGTSIVIALLCCATMYFIMNASVQRTGKRAEKCEETHESLIRALLAKQGIIDGQRKTIDIQSDMIEQADSVLQETRPIINKIMKK